MSRMCGGICIIFFGCCLLSARQQTAYEKKNLNYLHYLTPYCEMLRTGQEKIVSDEQKKEVIPEALVITLFHFDFFVIGKQSLCFRFQSFCAFHFQRINKY